jgi:hypothetical protein
MSADVGIQPARSSLTAPLAVWLAVQLIALALAAFRVPLSAHFIAPGEALAVHEMLVVQFAISAMLFPFLLRDARHLLVMMLTAAPMIQLAAMLAGTPTVRAVGTWTCLGMWLAALTLWRRALAPRFHPIAIAAANLLTIGGLFVWYFALEFRGPTHLPRITLFFPLVATLRWGAGEGSFLLPLLTTAFLAGIATCVMLARHSRAQRMTRA